MYLTSQIFIFGYRLAKANPSTSFEFLGKLEQWITFPLNVHYIVFMWLVKGLFMGPENVSKIEPFSRI